MKLIVGLGNPEKRYEGTRHNAGFMVVDRLVRRHAPGERVRARFRGDTIETPIALERCLLLKPMTYMNRSGAAVQEAVAFFKIDPAKDLLVVTDDLALPVGVLRLRAQGSAGGHNGLADISRALGGDAYPRLRVGIGAKPAFMDQADYVLSRFTEEEAGAIERAVDRGADAVEVFVREGIGSAMNRFNERVQADARPGDGGADGKDREPPPGTDPGWMGGSARA